MSSHNPYAAPQSAFSRPNDAGDEIWRIKKIVVLRRDGALPDRCIKCNAPAITPYKKQTLFWHHPAVYLLILLNLLIYALVAMFVRRTVKLEIGLCAEHQKRLWWARVIGWGGFVLIMAGCIISAAAESASLALLTAALGLIWIIVTIAINRLLIAARIGEEYIQLKGCGPHFLDSLPVFQGKPD